MDQSVKQGVIEFGHGVGYPSVDIHDQLAGHERLGLVEVDNPTLEELLELSESVGTGHELVQVCVKFLAKLGLVL